MGINKIVYIDMVNVLVDFKSGIDRLDGETRVKYEGCLDEVPSIFSLMDTMLNAIESVKRLASYYELYIRSTAPWLNQGAWIDKLKWVQKHFGKHEGSLFYKRLIMSHNKNLNTADFLIDDRPNNWAREFKGEWIQFGFLEYLNWLSVTKYLI